MSYTVEYMRHCRCIVFIRRNTRETRCIHRVIINVPVDKNCRIHERYCSCIVLIRWNKCETHYFVFHTVKEISEMHCVIHETLQMRCIHGIIQWNKCEIICVHLMKELFDIYTWDFVGILYSYRERTVRYNISYSERNAWDILCYTCDFVDALHSYSEINVR